MSKFYSNPGSRIKIVYSPKLHEDGSFELVETGKEDVQEFIDSFAEETCMALIIKRCEMGDTSVLAKRQGTYGDFLDVPKTYRDFLQIAIDGRNYFDSLPVEMKNQFGNSFERWMSTIGEKEWFEIMQQLDVDNTIPQVKEEVIKDAE